MTGYLQFLEERPGPREDENLRKLADILDDLIALGRNTPHRFDDDQPDPPERDLARWAAVAARRFPSLGGGYNIPVDITRSIADTELACGHAIDDLGDIAGDLSEVLWRFEHTSDDDALWHFRWGYENHWGKHASDLRWYLHALEFDY